MEFPVPVLKQARPQDARKVFSGVLYEVYQWQQKQYDGSYKTFEQLKRTDTVHIIAITQEKEFIILRQEQPGSDVYLGLPGGMKEQDADPLITAKRELLEETGYISDDFALFDVTQPNSEIDWRVYTFLARDCCKIGEQHLDSGERVEVQLVSFDSFLDIATSPEFNDMEMAVRLIPTLKDPQKKAALRTYFGV